MELDSRRTGDPGSGTSRKVGDSESGIRQSKMTRCMRIPQRNTRVPSELKHNLNGGGSREKAGLVMFFSCKGEHLTLIPGTHIKSWPSYQALGRQRQAEPWGSLCSQSGLLGKPQANDRSCLDIR